MTEGGRKESETIQRFDQKQKIKGAGRSTRSFLKTLAVERGCSADNLTWLTEMSSRQQIELVSPEY